jgi:ligand-binding sensor domain-containing protein
MFVVVFWIFSLCSPSYAVLTEENLAPFIRNYSPEEHGGNVSNACVVQDKRGVIFVGNAQGILEFDGVEWRFLPTPRNVSVKSLACDRYGRVFVGAEDNVFGVLSTDAKGRLAFRSLAESLPSLPGDFEVFWELIATPQYLYARSDKYLVRFKLKENPRAPLEWDKMWTAEPGREFHLMFKAGQTLYVRIKGKGLHKIRGDEPVLMPEGEIFADEKIYFVTVAPGATVEDPDPPIFIATREHGFFVYDPLARGERLRAYRTEADEYLKTHPIYRSARLPSGEFAIGTLSGGLIILYPNGKIRRVIDEAAGLQNNSILEAYPDAVGGIWLALDYGVSYIEPMPAAFTKQSIFDGKRRLVNQVARHKGRLYIATTIGVCVGKYEPSGSIQRFVIRALPGLNSICPAVLSVDDKLWVGSDQGLYVYDETLGFYKFDSTLDVKALHRHGDRIYVGLLSGMAVYEKRGGFWVRVPAPKLKGEIYSFAADKDGTLWAGVFNTGFIKIAPDGTIQRYAFKDRAGGWYRVFSVHGKLFFATPRGIYRESGSRLERHPDFAISGPVHAIVEYGTSAYVIHYENAIGQYETRKFDASGKIIPTSLSTLKGWGFDRILSENEGILWLAGPKGLVRYEPMDSTPAVPFPPLLRKLILLRDSVVFFGAFVNEYGGLISQQSPNVKFVIPFKSNSIRIEYGIPIYRQASPLQFQFYLEKFDESPPDDWSNAPFKEYTNLSEGRYTLWVTAKDEQGNVSSKAAVSFEISPPWNRTILFYSGIVATLLVVMFLVYRYFSVPIQRQNKLLGEDNRFLNVDISAKSLELRRMEEAMVLKNAEIARLSEAVGRSDDRERQDRQRIHQLETQQREWSQFANLLREITAPDPSLIRREFPSSFVHYHSSTAMEIHFLWCGDLNGQFMLAVGCCQSEHAPPALSGLFAQLAFNQIVSRYTNQGPESLAAAFADLMDKHRFNYALTLCIREKEAVAIYGPPATLLRNGKILEACGRVNLLAGDKLYIFSLPDFLPPQFEFLEEYPFVEHPYRIDLLFKNAKLETDVLIVGIESTT